jgi:signal transduction histidine kinase
MASETLEERRLSFVLLAVLAAVVYLFIRQVIVLAFAPLFTPLARSAVSVRHYSQQLSKGVELDNLIAVATTTLNQVMGVRRSGLMLINDTSADHNSVEFLVMQEGEDDGTKGYISKGGPLYARLAADRQAVSQFDIDYGPRYGVLSAREREFFDQLNMSAYAPIVVEDVLIGVLMCGPKLNDAPFYARDLDLLATMADQTGVALRNARTLADLRHLNTTMRSLNHELEDANDQYGKLDSVKTDFITIASHELRTPLAQIRGYVDILDAVNEQGMLDKDQVTGMVANLRKAIERTEELISAMLDVSQLDVKAMDLRFAQASPETIVRMAIEPLTEHIKQRKLTLSARGLRGLPGIQCDMQRLVQAFRNIVTNAIKFTPDGGRIDITASFQEGDAEMPEHILVAISDTGVGIDRENLELIFEKFYRAADPNLHSTGSYKFMGAGPGLGLTIARGVIEGHGGKIWVESSGHNMETYPGSTFYIILPVTPPEETRRVLIEDSVNDFTPTRRPAGW